MFLVKEREEIGQEDYFRHPLCEYTWVLFCSRRIQNAPFSWYVPLNCECQCLQMVFKVARAFIHEMRQFAQNEYAH